MLRLAGSARFSRCNPKRSFLRQDRADGRIVRIMAKFPSASAGETFDRRDRAGAPAPSGCRAARSRIDRRDRAGAPASGAGSWPVDGGDGRPMASEDEVSHGRHSTARRRDGAQPRIR